MQVALALMQVTQTWMPLGYFLCPFPGVHSLTRAAWDLNMSVVSKSVFTINTWPAGRLGNVFYMEVSSEEIIRERFSIAMFIYH